MLQRINGGEAPIQPGTKVGGTLNELTGGRLSDLVNRAGADAQQGRLAADSSQDAKVLLGRDRGGDEAHNRSPRRRSDGHNNGSSYGREIREESEKSGTRGAENGTRDLEDRETRAREFRMNGRGPTVERVVDWKTEFQQEGLTA